MIHPVIMPQGGQDIEKGTVVTWLKQEGDPVSKNELICEVETEKATFEVLSPASGYLRKILVPAGEEAAILATIAIVGELQDRLDPAEHSLPAAAKTAGAALAGPGPEDKDAVRLPERRPRISPRARRAVREHGVPLEELHSTGPQGRIVEKDVLRYLEMLEAARPAEGPVGETGKSRQIQLSKTWQRTARRLQQSKQTVPHFYITRAIDMTRALKYRQELPARQQDAEQARVSVNDLILRACALAIREYPQINASYSESGQMVFWEDINIGSVVAVGEELIAPVLENADRLGLLELSEAARQLIESARQGKLTHLAPTRFTISNLGMYGIDNFIAIINPPETAVLAISSIQKMLMVSGDATPVVRDMMNATLSIDHRVCNGVLACRFINHIKTLLENPERLG